MADLVEYRHPRLGFAVAVPEAWDRVEDARGMALIVAQAGSGPSRFRPNMVAAVDQMVADATPRLWHAYTIEKLRQQLNAFWLVDIEHPEADGWNVARTLGHHTTESDAITVEQWLMFDAGQCVTLTASVGTLEYAGYADLFGSIASSFRLPGEAS